MKAATAWALLAFSLLCCPWSHTLASKTVDVSGVERAYGTIVDSVTVSGTEDTKPYVVLREMETQPGDVLDADIIHRDIRFITDLSPFATVSVRADSVAPGHSIIRIAVTERSSLFIKSVLPFVNYDFEDGLTYGIRWKDRNFRGRLEQLNFTYKRTDDEDDDFSISWSAPWIGWKHIAVAGQLRYFNRGKVSTGVSVLEQTAVSGFVALPLTESRIRFAQVEGSLSLVKTRNGGMDQDTEKEVTVSPQVGFRFDSRDSGLRPETGFTFFIAPGASIPTVTDRNLYYRLRTNVRSFTSLTDRIVLALQTDVFYQFGDFPDYSIVRIGGAGTLRGQPDGRFRGFHRWFNTIELRYLYLPRTVFDVPLVKYFDASMAFVSFVDAAIVWTGAEDFDLEHFHGTGGVGLRFYSPLRDVVRLDFGFNTRGDARFHFGTGIRF